MSGCGRCCLVRRDYCDGTTADVETNQRSERCDRGFCSFLMRHCDVRTLYFKRQPRKSGHYSTLCRGLQSSLAHMFLRFPRHTDNIRLRAWLYTMDWHCFEYGDLPMLPNHTWGMVRAIRLLYIDCALIKKGYRAHDCGD